MRAPHCCRFWGSLRGADYMPAQEFNDRIAIVTGGSSGNGRGAFLTTRRAAKNMINAKGGAIVNVSSISGVIGPEKFPGFSAYCASKAALIELTEALAVELKEHGIRINCVSPGSVDTPMWAAVSGGAPADMTATEVAEVILFLASDRARPINGQNIHVYSA